MTGIMESFELDLITQMEDLLDDFYRDLLMQGLKASTAEKHVANSDLFLIQYHAFHFLQGIEAITPERLYDFLGVWYFQKILSPSSSDMVAIMSSIKRLVNFLYQQNHISMDLRDRLKQVTQDKSYFLNRYEEYMADPQHYAEPQDLSEEELTEIANNFIDSNPMLEEWEENAENEEVPMTMKEILEHLNKLVTPPNSTSNVIFLDPTYGNKSDKVMTLPTAEKPYTLSVQSLEDHCLAIHRSNLIFIRWLDRFSCHPSELPPDSFGLCVSLDSMVESLLLLLNQEEWDQEKIEQTHELLDVMDRMLWNARHNIARQMGLDLRLLTI